MGRIAARARRALTIAGIVLLLALGLSAALHMLADVAALPPFWSQPQEVCMSRAESVLAFFLVVFMLSALAISLLCLVRHLHAKPTTQQVRHAQ